MEILSMVFGALFFGLFIYVFNKETVADKRLNELERQLKELDGWSQK